MKKLLILSLVLAFAASAHADKPRTQLEQRKCNPSPACPCTGWCNPPVK